MRSQCLCSKTVRVDGLFIPTRVTQPFHCCKFLVTIGASTPSQNMHVQKWAYCAIMNEVKLADQVQTDSWAHNFTLPSALWSKEEIIFLIQQDMPIRDVETCGNNAIADWARLKRRNARVRREMKWREMLVKLRAAIHQAHKENLDENDIPICLMPQNWRNLWVKKEHPPTPIWPPLLRVKEELVTPQLQYLALELSLGYTSLNPNNFDWGENLMVD